MNRYAIVVGCLVALTGCSQQTTPPPAEGKLSVVPEVAVTLTSADMHFKAWAEVGSGVKAPSIPLRLTFKNDTSEQFPLAKVLLTIEVDAQNSKRHETKTFPIPDSPDVLKPGTQFNTIVDAGAFLTQVASGYMKGDTLKVQAIIKWPSSSGRDRQVQTAPVTISIYVPEG